ncbi:MAG: HAD-IB family phosphatase [Methanomassiliicoccales archaeon]
MYKLFLFDMDGVLLQHKSSWEYCQRAIGCDLEHFYDEFGQDVLNGKDLTMLVLQKMMKHGFTQIKLQELARNAPQMKGIEEVLTAINAHRGSAVIISGGIGAFAQELLNQYPFTEYVCNELHFNGHDLPPTCEIKVGHDDKGKVARTIIDTLGVSKEETVAIGDYCNDCPMFAEAGLSIAFNGDQDAKVVATHSIDSDDLADILPIIFGQK